MQARLAGFGIEWGVVVGKIGPAIMRGSIQGYRLVAMILLLDAMPHRTYWDDVCLIMMCRQKLDDMHLFLQQRCGEPKATQ